jgi:AcrR family transcriptional regulator
MSSVETILNAAERIFATRGYEGASMRQIAEQAGVAQALLHYHFKTKEKLYAAIFSRRSATINSRRKARLNAILADGRDATLEDVLDALFMPAPDSSDKPASANFYQQMVTAISVAGDERSKSLMTEFYDPIAQEFIAALQKALPELSKVSAVWAYLFALGARMQANARNGRASRLSKGAIAKNDMTSAQAHIIPFVAAGIRQLARQSSLLDTRQPRPRRAVGRKPVASKRSSREGAVTRLTTKSEGGVQ